MNRKPALLLIFVLLIPLISGCAGIVIGGIAMTASVVHDRRTAGSYLEDQNIELKAIDRINDKAVRRDSSSISITSYNQIILLTGQVESAEVKANSAALMKSIAKVKRVVNELEIGAVATAGETTSDTYITAKVKLKLINLGIPGFDTTLIKIKTERGIVYLMGLITQQEANAIVERVRTISDVKKVVKVFEII
ncbi:MAG: BON domain-containing protein [Candidatus Polarisedimenticolaceae bacterium]|nr:BON domain-containing protein [Candidatus Polarisedimenticolaceae bacterium]